MSVALDSKPALVDISPLEKAILETLAYSDVFDYPLTLDELHRFLTISATVSELQECMLGMKNIQAMDS